MSYDTISVSSTSFHLLDCLHKSMKNLPIKTDVQIIFLMMNT